MYKSADLKVVSLVNMKGGVAKTTLGVNIADYLSRQDNFKVLIIDIDPQFNATQYLMSGQSYKEHLAGDLPTIYHIFDDSQQIVGGITGGLGHRNSLEYKDIEPIEIRPQLFLLPGSIELYRLDMMPSLGREFRLKAYIDVISQKHNFDYIIIDTPPTPSSWMTSALIASHYYLIPTKPDPLSFIGIDLLESLVEHRRRNFDLNIKCAGLVLTLCDRNTNVYANTKIAIQNSDRWKKYAYTSDVPRRTSIAESSEHQHTILDGENLELQGDLASIVRELRRRIE